MAGRGADDGPPGGRESGTRAELRQRLDGIIRTYSKTGDDAGFGELLRIAGKLVDGRIWNMCREWMSVEDTAQHGAAAMAERIKQRRPFEQDALGYMYVTMLNYAKSVFKKQKACQELPPEKLELLAAPGAPPGAGGRYAEETLRLALGRISELCQRLLRLLYYEALPLSRIRQQLEPLRRMKQRTAYTKPRQCLQELRQACLALMN